MTASPAPHLSRDRLVGITARTAHLVAGSVYVGGRVVDRPEGELRIWRRLTVLTGVALLVTEARHSRDWPRQGRGLSTFAHVAALAPARLSPAAAKVSPLVALVIGSVGSHLSKSIRTWTILKRPGGASEDSGCTTGSCEHSRRG
ncbi:hypothetical protein [Streptomyces sp. YIM S03343]